MACSTKAAQLYAGIKTETRGLFIIVGSCKTKIGFCLWFQNEKN
jgi:hypothetical protein